MQKETKRHNWEVVQKLLDSGITRPEIGRMFDISDVAFYKAHKRGSLKDSSRKEKLRRDWKEVQNIIDGNVPNTLKILRDRFKCEKRDLILAARAGLISFNFDKIKKTSEHLVDWDAVQVQYDSGKSIQTLTVEFEISPSAFYVAKKRGDFVPRTVSESLKIRSKKFPRYSFDDKNTIRFYRNACRFKFSLKAFSEEFDFSLIEKYGWYKASNRGNNPGGVSRDHIISVKYGFENKIDSEIISHPANCRLMLQSENSSKHGKSDMRLDELVDKIIVWNKKYAP